MRGWGDLQEETEHGHGRCAAQQWLKGAREDTDLVLLRRMAEALYSLQMTPQTFETRQFYAGQVPAVC